jgi:GT2 family glycosyltransferase
MPARATTATRATRTLNQATLMNQLSSQQDGLVGTDAGWADRIAALHRARFIGALCVGRRVWLADAGAVAGVLAEVAGSLVMGGPPPDGADVVLALDPAPPRTVLAAMAGLARAVRGGGTLVMASCPDHTPDGGWSAIETALARDFHHVASYHQRPVVGTLLADARLSDSRIVALADEPAAPGAMLHVCSNMPLPDLAGGVFGAPPATAVGLAAGMGQHRRPARAPGQRLAEPSNPIELPEDGLRDENALELRRRAVSLVERLIERDERQFELVTEVAQLRRALEEQAAPGGGGFDVPRDQHGWPLAEDPEKPVAEFGFYDHRVDDVVIVEARAGDVFRKRFGLAGGAADHAAAIAALNAMPRRLRLAGGDGIPDVSIVVPVHGQLGYTLNCLDSLFRHAARRTVEIIVIDDASPDASGEMLPTIEGIRVLRQEVNRGFLDSCNAGAAMARGGTLVLLNNDTRVVEGWLDELLDGFTLFPRAGLVGSKLFNPDGSLQEAGGIIWRDGSAWNYGRGDDPNRPQYCHARQVDFVSGASIAVPAALWRRIGGFDGHFAPAYNEDSDLCFRLRAAGHEIWLQPQSRVIHYEGRTAGTDTRTGVKAFQVVNARKFLVRWHKTLADHRPNGVSPYFERERRMHRRALVVDATAPTPDQDAGSITTVLKLRVLQQLGYKVHFVAQDNFLFQPKYTTALLREGIECAYVPYDTGFEAYLRRYGGLFDVVLVFRVTVLVKTLEALRRYAPQAPVLFSNMDLHFLRMQREAQLAGDAAGIAAAEAMKQLELDMIGKADCTITPSTYEERLIGELAADAPVQVLPFMIDFEGTSVGFAPRRDICFLGGFRHTPNVDAVQFFVREVFPKLKRAQPGIRFIIAGAHPPEAVKALAAEDVIVTGMVPDLRDLFDAVRVFVCPLRAGAGVKGKVSTAMSYGVPVVMTSISAEGMELSDGEHMLLADTPAALAAACLRAYRDEALWQRLSDAGQALVRQKHSTAMGQRVLAEAIDTALRHRLGVDALA